MRASEHVDSDPVAQKATASARLAAARERLDALINWERKGRGRMRVSLEPALDLCARLGNPQRGVPAVHIAGSKGKGSVAALVAEGLTAAGLRTGRYGSPHVERIQERVVIDGAEVGDGELAEGLEQSLSAREQAIANATAGAEATWFDLLTAAAWCVFRAAQVEWLVVECGLGGRLDSTNTLDGEVCAITTIELEHQNVLGSSCAVIAAEKAGILKPGCTLVTGVPSDTQAGRAIEGRARELGVPVLRPNYLSDPGSLPTIESCNTALAALILDELGRRGHRGRDGRPLGARLLTPERVRAARLPGRLERLWLGRTPVVVDGAHTPESARRVVSDLTGPRRPQLAPGRSLRRRPVAVVGMGVDKDLAGVLKSLQGEVDRVLCTSVGGSLARTPEEIVDAARALDLVAETASDPGRALERARDLAGDHGWVLVLGSLYLAGAVRPLLEREPSDPKRC
jgi:dihydrofolate synthase/folylpolyglutamate synthase